MPLYEYFCDQCDGVFEQRRSIRESSEPAPCPLCDRESERIMPTSFLALTVREGLPRRLPDTGTYWHLGKAVKQMNTGGVPAFQHPELYKPVPPKAPTRGELSDITEMEHLESVHARQLHDSDEMPTVRNDGKPNLSAKRGASGHVGDQEIYETERARASDLR